MGYTQEQAARRLDITLRHYCRYERDADVPPKRWRGMLALMLEIMEPPRPDDETQNTSDCSHDHYNRTLGA